MTSKLEDMEATLRDQDGEKQKLQQEVQSSKGESERLRAMLRLGPFCWFYKTVQPLFVGSSECLQCLLFETANMCLKP